MAQTLTDELIGMGFAPHPDTVIVRIELGNTPLEQLEGIVKVDPDKPVAPMFDYVALEMSGEWRHSGYSGHTTVLAYVEKREDGIYRVSRFGRNRVNGETHYTYVDVCGGFRLDDGKFLIIHDDKYQDVYEATYDAPQFFARQRPDFLRFKNDSADLTAMNAIWLFQKLDEKADIELVHPTNAKMRRVERETGKKPSPYVLLRLEGLTPTKKTARDYHPKPSHEKKSLHRVRAHFRRVESHPFIPDGVYYIPPHLRGDGEKGDYRRDYRIVLNTNQTQS